MRSQVLTVIGVLIIVGAVAAYYYTTVGASSSQGSEVSSLRSVASSLSQVVASQGSQIQSLQSQQSSVGETTTVTVTTSASASAASTVTTTSTTTVFSTTTSRSTTTATTTSTVTVVYTTVLTAGGSDLAMLTGSLTIPGGNGSGTLTLMVADTGTDPIIDINVTVPSGSNPLVDLCSATCAIQLSYNNNVVSLNNPLPGENNAVGSLSTDQGQAGNTYTVYVTIVFADGTSQTPSINLAPQT